MKVATNRFFILFIAGFLSISAAFASNTATTNVTVQGQIIKALTITIDAALRFGEVAVPQSGTAESATEATITVTNPGTGVFTITYANNGSPDSSASSNGTSTYNRRVIGPGKITVNGQANYYYAATGGWATGLPGGVSVVVDPFSGTRRLDASGQDTAYLGGTFTVLRGATLGEASGTANITVTYD